MQEIWEIYEGISRSAQRKLKKQEDHDILLAEA